MISRDGPHNVRKAYSGGLRTWVHDMNVFTYVLAEGEIDEKPELEADTFVVDDNVGEAVHIHYRATRFEYSIDDFVRFAEECEAAREVLQRGDR